MALNKGKQFEQKFKEDWLKTFPRSILIRLPDQQSFYYGSSRNPCDYVAYNKKHFFMLECKTHKGNTFPLSNFTQYDLLSTFPFSDIEGSHCGIILWMIEHENAIFYIPIQTVTKMKKDGLKSFNVLKHDFQKYKVVKIPSKKKRTFYDSDYSVLLGE